MADDTNSSPAASPDVGLTVTRIVHTTVMNQRRHEATVRVVRPRTVAQSPGDSSPEVTYHKIACLDPSDAAGLTTLLRMAAKVAGVPGNYETVGEAFLRDMLWKVGGPSV